MSVFVILSLALFVMAVGAAVVAVLQLRAALARLRAALQTTATTIAPLTEELQAETAVTGVEVAALRTRLDTPARPEGSTETDHLS